MSRLTALQAENDAAAVRILEHNHRFQRIRGEKPRAVSSFNLFQTPPELAARMVGMLPDIEGYPCILEPSAGLGRIYRALWDRYNDQAFYTLVDISPDCCRELRGMTEAEHCCIKESDFLQMTPAMFKYDFVVMNPPFKQGRDIKHIMHAVQWLKPSGLLVGLCYNGVRQGERLRSICDTWEVLPSRTFRESGTGADVVLFTIKGKDRI